MRAVTAKRILAALDDCGLWPGISQGNRKRREEKQHLIRFEAPDMAYARKKKNVKKMKKNKLSGHHLRAHMRVTFTAL